MADIEKVIKAWERCKVCNTSVLSDEPGKQAYIDCEYTTGLYCRQDKLIYETLELLKEQPRIVLCKNCEHYIEKTDDEPSSCLIKAGYFPVSGDWYCADGKVKE